MKHGIISGILGGLVCSIIIVISGGFNNSILAIIGISVLVGLFIGSVYYLSVHKFKIAKLK